jgi:diacylglycerol kinase (ATP)
MPAGALRVALVANSSSGSADRVDEVAGLLRAAGGAVERVALEAFCDGPGAVDGDRLAREAARLRDTADRVVVAGGDGSVGPAALLALRAGLPLAVLPTGTANSFVRWLELPLDVPEAARLAAAPHAATRTAEVAEAAGRPFVNVAAVGLSVLAADRARPLKRRLGALAYAVGALRAGVAGRPLRCTVTCDGRVAWRGAAWQVLVAATGAFGGANATGGVDPTDHALDVAIVEAGPRLALARRAFAMRRARLVHDDGVTHVRGRTVELDLRAGTRFNVDGEVLRPVPQRFSVLGTVAVVAPGVTGGAGEVTP